MKILNVGRWLLAAGAMLPFSLGTTLAADPVSATPESTVVVQSAPTAPVKLPYGVEDVLKLSKAQVSDDIVVNYIQNSGTVYNLSSQDILYLRNQGVSDRVIGAMLNQKTAVQQQAAQAAAAAASAPDANTAAAVSAPVAPVVEAQPAASSVYVIPYPDTTYAYYGGYPYYYPYYAGGYCPPVVSFGFGFGGPVFGRPGFGHPGRGFPGPGHFAGGFHGGPGFHGGVGFRGPSGFHGGAGFHGGGGMHGGGGHRR